MSLNKQETTSPALIIGEIGVNHNGDLDTAIRLVDAAADAGADLVKFQTFNTMQIVTRSARKAEYQIRNMGGEDNNQMAMLQALELDQPSHRVLIEHCQARQVGFLSTPFDFDSAKFLIDELGLKQIKVGSGDMSNAPHLLFLAQRGVDVILSTGMATMHETSIAMGALAFGYLGRKDKPSPAAFIESLTDPRGCELLARKTTVMHCTSNYPAPFDEINLAVMETLRKEYPCQIGFSDHSEGYAVAVAAVALGARMLEKHLTLDRKQPGPDHWASIEPSTFRDMVQAIREVERAVGSPDKIPTASEIATKAVARKSLVAATSIPAGEAFNESNLAIKRPGTGMAPELFWGLLGRKASRDYEPDDLISEPE